MAYMEDMQWFMAPCFVIKIIPFGLLSSYKIIKQRVSSLINQIPSYQTLRRLIQPRPYTRVFPEEVAVKIATRSNITSG